MAARDLVVAVALACLVVARSAGAQRMVIAGVVRDEAGMPIENALVTLDGDQRAVRHVRTNVTGEFVFGRVQRGFHGLSTMRIGYSPDERVVEALDSLVAVTIVLRRLPQSLDTLRVVANRSGVFGQVLAHGGTVPLDSAAVTLMRTRWSATTGRDGRFDIPATMETGALVLFVRHPGYQSKMTSISVSPDHAVEVAVVLDSISAAGGMRRAMPLAEMEERVRYMGSRAALVPANEIAGYQRMSLRDAIALSPTYLRANLRLSDRACLFVNGLPRLFGTTNEFEADEIESVEVYGPKSEWTGTLARRWGEQYPKFPCGDPDCNNMLPRCVGDVTAVVVWLKQPD